MEKEGNNLFQVNLKGMIALLSEHIYSNPNTFVRELLQNCVDAITALRNIDENYKGRIDVFLNEDKTVVFRWRISDEKYSLFMIPSRPSR